MPVVSQPGGAPAIIEQPLPNFGDAPVDKARRDRLLYAAPFADALKHVKKMDAHYTSLRQARENQRIAATNAKSEATARRERIILEYQKTGTKLTPRATHDEDEIIREANEALAGLNKKVPVLDSDEIARKAPRYLNSKRHDKTYFDGDTRHWDDKRKTAKGIRIEKERAFEDILHAPRHSDDAAESMRRDLRLYAENGKPVVGAHLLGVTTDHKGDFQLNRNPKTEFPETWSKANYLSQDRAMVDNALCFLVWSHFDSVAAALEKQIRAEARDDDAIRDADRPAMLAKARAELLEAQRAEEFANKACERMGIAVFRPSDWPVEVILEVEPPTKTAPTIKVKAPPVVVDDADDFEGDADEGDDA
ncbi:MAG: hypothetical protein KIT48_04595 [Pseudolabrys sp.]|nr:hypothetical protein [Pseudolabrys sp.]